MIIDRSRLEDGDEIKLCKICGEEFLLFNSTKRHIESKGFKVSNKCYDCRNKKEFIKYEDKIKICQECGQEFPWTAGEQSYYAKNEIKNEPKFCKSCRFERREYFNSIK